MGLIGLVHFSALKRLVAQQQVFVMAHQLFFKQASGFAVFNAQQLNKAPAFDFVIQLADVTARL